MVPRKAVCGIALSATIALGMGAFASTGYALTDWEPTLLGNDEYTNQIDTVNDYGVEGIYYTAQIAEQNSDEVAATRALDITIGTDGDNVSPVKVTNSTGKNIKELTFRWSDESSYPANSLSSALANGKSACWFYEVAYGEYAEENQVGITYQVPANMMIKATFDDGTTAEFHNLNMSALRTVNLCYSKDYGVYYVERTTITNHTPDPNLYYEVNLSEYTGTDEEFNFHVNSGARMGELCYTESRGFPWHVGHGTLQTITDYGIELPLYGEPSGDYTDGVYSSLYWNSNNLPWRGYNND